MADAERITRWDRLSPDTHPTPAEIQDQAQEMLERGRSRDVAEALRRGEQVHRELEIALGVRPTLEQLLQEYTLGRSIRWNKDLRLLIRRLTGETWHPDIQSPPHWAPPRLADAWHREAHEEIFRDRPETDKEPAEPAIDRPEPVEAEPTFDEPEGECRKSAESAVKPRLELVPFECVEEIAEVLTFGAAKYEANNWARGARWGRYFAALLRHLFAWWRGENLDSETGKSHLAHAGCCLFFLMAYQRHGWGEDDRFLGPDDKPFTKHDGATDAA